MLPQALLIPHQPIQQLHNVRQVWTVLVDAFLQLARQYLHVALFLALLGKHLGTLTQSTDGSSLLLGGEKALDEFFKIFLSVCLYH